MSLVMKEILLIKKFIPLVFLMAVILPIVLNQTGNVGSTLNFISIILIFAVMLPGSISMNESKYQKAYAYLSITPYSKSTLVLCKYVFDLIVFVFTTLVYSIEALIVPQYITSINVITVAAAFLGMCLLRGFMIPAEFKFGYENTKYISIIVVMVVGFGIPLIIKSMGNAAVANSFMDFFMSLPQYVLSILLFASGLVISIVSFIISLSIFQNKEL